MQKKKVTKKSVDKTLAGSEDRIRKRIRNLETTLVAFSGSLDSTILARVCREELGDKAIAVTVLPFNYPKEELEDIRRVAKQIGIEHRVVKNEDGVTCEGKMFSQLKQVSRELGFKNVVSAGHVDDELEEKMSFVSAKEKKIIMPYHLEGMRKRDVLKMNTSKGNAEQKKGAAKKQTKEKKSGK
ncbi:hypothetical protein HY990_00925 [Candidatus Micrarchaeota archaeon]|nr:hypothetical protein [Candidatus Micrarchaeota archaeon]